MTVLTRFLAERSPRERVLLAVLAASLLLWLGVAQVWVPLQAQRRDLLAEISRLARALTLVQTAGATPPAAAAPVDPRAMPALITDAADRFGVTISRLQPEAAHLRIALDDAAFDTVILWIEALLRDDGLRLVDLTLTRRTAPGIVGATLTVGR